MSHATTLDNGVVINYDGGDLGGKVYIVLPDGRKVTTRWDEIAVAPELLEELKNAADALELAAQVLSELDGPGVPTFRKAAQDARAAIAKAQPAGEEP